MTRLTLLFLIAALVLPGAAAAAPALDRDASAIAAERYYSSYGDPQPIAVTAPAPAASGNEGPSWLGAIGIGAGLMLLAGGLGVYAGRTVRPRGLGA